MSNAEAMLKPTQSKRVLKQSESEVEVDTEVTNNNNLSPVPAPVPHYAARARNLPERPEPSASLDAYVAYLDAMCAHVRGMAVKAGRLYHEAKLAELEGAG